jgi:hypothetical protein
VGDQTEATKKRCPDEGSRLMPKAIPDIEGFKFSFWSNENDEPIHVHVYKAGAGQSSGFNPRLCWLGTKALGTLSFDVYSQF